MKISLKTEIIIYKIIFVALFLNLLYHCPLVMVAGLILFDRLILKRK